MSPLKDNFSMNAVVLAETELDTLRELFLRMARRLFRRAAFHLTNTPRNVRMVHIGVNVDEVPTVTAETEKEEAQ